MNFCGVNVLVSAVGLLRSNGLCLRELAEAGSDAAVCDVIAQLELLVLQREHALRHLLLVFTQCVLPPKPLDNLPDRTQRRRRVVRRAELLRPLVEDGLPEVEQVGPPAKVLDRLERRLLAPVQAVHTSVAVERERSVVLRPRRSRLIAVLYGGHRMEHVN